MTCPHSGYLRSLCPPLCTVAYTVALTLSLTCGDIRTLAPLQIESLLLEISESGRHFLPVRISAFPWGGGTYCSSVAVQSQAVLLGVGTVI